MYIDSSSEDESVSEQTSSHTDLQPQQATPPTATAPVTTDVTVTSAMYSAVADVARDDDEPAVNSAPVASVPAPSSSTVIHHFL